MQLFLFLKWHVKERKIEHAKDKQQNGKFQNSPFTRHTKLIIVFLRF
jgi:hypothetical protein